MRCNDVQSRDVQPEFPRPCELAYINPKEDFHIIRNRSFLSFPLLPFAVSFFFFESHTFFSSRTVRTQACPHRKQVLARDARGQVGEVLGAVVDSVLVAEAETHACSRGVAGGGGDGGVGWWGDEGLDGGAHVVC